MKQLSYFFLTFYPFISKQDNIFFDVCASAPTWWAASRAACWAPRRTAGPTGPAWAWRERATWMAKAVRLSPSSWSWAWPPCCECDAGSAAWGSARGARPQSDKQGTKDGSQDLRVIFVECIIIYTPYPCMAIMTSINTLLPCFERVLVFRWGSPIAEPCRGSWRWVGPDRRRWGAAPGNCGHRVWLGWGCCYW